MCPLSFSRKNSLTVVCVLAFAGAFPCAPMRLFSQALTTGSLTGVVRDLRRVAVGDATVTLRSSGATNPLVVHTDGVGLFQLDELQPGVYDLTCERSGFSPLHVQRVEIAAGQTLQLLLALPVAGVAQSVTVVADDVERPSLADSPLNASLSPRELLSLPIDGRRFQNFALLTPLTNLADDSGVPDSSGNSTDNPVGEPAPVVERSAETVQVATRAVDPSQDSFTQDGFTDNRSFDGAPRGGRSVPFNVPLEAVREFQVRAVSSGSPLGRHIGGSVNAVTRRAGDSLHGTAFFQIRNSMADASDPFAIATRYNNGAPSSSFVKPRDQREQFGGSIGSGLPGNRVYVFVAGEGQRRSFPGISSPGNPDFYRLTTVQRDLLANRGVSAAQAAAGLTFLDSLTGEVPRHSNTVAITPRLDIVTSAKSALLATYTGVRHDALSGARDTAVLPQSRDNFATRRIAADTLVLSESVALGSRWLMQAGTAISEDDATLGNALALPQEPGTGPGGVVPQVTIDLADNSTGGAFRFGTPVSAQRRRLPDERRAEFEAGLTFLGHRHTVRMLASGSLVDTAVDAGAATSGAYQYASRSTGGRAGGLVDFLTDYTYSATSYPNGGCPSIYAAVHLFCFQSFSQSFGSGLSVRFHTGEAAASLEEAWRITPRLHLTVGARYEYFRMPLPQHANASLDAIFGNLGLTTYYPGDPGNLAPRLGIAYGLGGRTVVRLGYGMYYGRITGRVLQQLLTNTSTLTSTYNVRFTPTTEVDPACSSAGTNFGYPATYICGGNGRQATTSAAAILSSRFQLPMEQVAELSIERELPHGFQLSVSYAGAIGHDLPNSTDVNIAPSTGNAVFTIQRTDTVTTPGLRNGSTFSIPLYTARVSPVYGPVSLVLSNGNSAYQAGVVQLSRVATRGVTVRATYTFSKSLDTLRSSGAGVQTDSQFDPFDPRFDRALSNLDRRHKIVASAVWAPQVDHSSHLMRSIGSGFTLAPLVFITSGRPYSYLVEGGTELPGGRESLNGSGGATYLPNVGRNTLRLPMQSSIDVRLARSFALTPMAHLRLSVEGFNIFNRRNVTSVTQRAFLVGTPVAGVTPLIFQNAAAIAAEGLTTQPFGTPVSSGTDQTRARRLQAGLRIDW